MSQAMMKRALVAMTFLLLGAAHYCSAAEVRLEFEDIPAKTVLTGQYGIKGVIFPNGAFLDSDAAARSGTRVVRSADPTGSSTPARAALASWPGSRACACLPAPPNPPHRSWGR